jgi:hypothetical protein
MQTLIPATSEAYSQYMHMSELLMGPKLKSKYAAGMIARLEQGPLLALQRLGVVRAACSPPDDTCVGSSELPDAQTPQRLYHTYGCAIKACPAWHKRGDEAWTRRIEA